MRVCPSGNMQFGQAIQYLVVESSIDISSWPATQCSLKPVDKHDSNKQNVNPSIYYMPRELSMDIATRFGISIDSADNMSGMPGWHMVVQEGSFHVTLLACHIETQFF